VCSQCDVRCRECTGPINRNCVTCNGYFKLFIDEKENDNFTRKKQNLSSDSEFDNNSLRTASPMGHSDSVADGDKDVSYSLS